MSIKLESPYLSSGAKWLKGNLHTHTTESDGIYDPQYVVDQYASNGYDFLMISDHDRLTDPEAIDSRGMVLIPGNEISAGGPHILHVGAKRRIEPHADRQLVLNEIGADGGLSIVNHPNWNREFNHCPQKYIDEWSGYDGMEVFNGAIYRLPGSPFAGDRWDRILAQGRRVWGFANDDYHRPDDFLLGWNVVQSESGTAADIVDALKTGRFYASTGVEIRRIEVTDDTITVESPNADRIAVSFDFGVRAHHVEGGTIEYRISPDVEARYYRVECYGRGEACAWTQPFFVIHR